MCFTKQKCLWKAHVRAVYRTEAYTPLQSNKWDRVLSFLWSIRAEGYSRVHRGTEQCIMTSQLVPIQLKPKAISEFN